MPPRVEVTPLQHMQLAVLHVVRRSHWPGIVQRTEAASAHCRPVSTRWRGWLHHTDAPIGLRVRLPMSGLADLGHGAPAHAPTCRRTLSAPRQAIATSSTASSVARSASDHTVDIDNTNSMSISTAPCSMPEWPPGKWATSGPVHRTCRRTRRAWTCHREMQLAALPRPSLHRMGSCSICLVLNHPSLTPVLLSRLHAPLSTALACRAQHLTLILEAIHLTTQTSEHPRLAE